MQNHFRFMFMHIENNFPKRADVYDSGLSMNILRGGGGGGNKSPVQNVFPKIAWAIYCLPQGF